MNFSRILPPILILSVAFFSSCEKEKEASLDTVIHSPSLRSASLTAVSINLDDSSDQHINKLPAGMFEILDTVLAQAIDPVDVKFRLYAPGENSYFATGILHRVVPKTVSPSESFTGAFSIVLSRTDIGVFRVEVFAEDTRGSLSNVSLQLPLRISRTNSAPILGSPTLREFTPNGSDSTRVTLTILASDSNGFADVASVMARAHNAMDSSFKLTYDDGDKANGDQAEGDGIFSTILWIKPNSSLREVTFEFVAADHEGALSNTVTRALSNHPPQIISLNVPDSIKRPAAGTQFVTFHQSNFDLDGIQDLDSAYFRNFTSSTPISVLMYDDGNLALHGDSTGGDGTYSRILSIDPTNTLGNKEFHFYVVDKLGAIDSLIKSIKIY